MNNLTNGKVINVGDHNAQLAHSINRGGSSIPSNASYQIINNQLISNINNSKNSKNLNSNVNQANQINKPVIERGASWSFNETRALLSLWGQDMVQRQLTNSKRTRHVWEKIAEKLNEIGYHRTPDQVRTRVFNMIAEYRRILKDSNLDRRKKCTFFDALDKIFKAKDANGVRAALDNYQEDQNFDLIEFNADENNQENDYMNNMLMDNLNSETSDLDDKEIFSYAMSPSHFNTTNQINQIGHVRLNGLNHQVVQLSNESRNRTPTSFLNSQSLNTSLNSNSDQLNRALMNQALAFQRLSTQTATASQHNSQTNSLSGDHYSDNHSDNSRDQFTMSSNKQTRLADDFPQQKKRRKQIFDYSQPQQIDSSTDAAAIIIDRMFEHLAKGTEAMREWIQLEERRLEQDIIRKQEQREREERREKKYLDAMVKMQNQMFQFLAKQSNSSYSIDQVQNLDLIGNLRKEFSDVNKDIDRDDSGVVDGDRIESDKESKIDEEILIREDKSSSNSDGTLSANDDDSNQINEQQEKTHEPIQIINTYTPSLTTVDQPAASHNNPSNDKVDLVYKEEIVDSGYPFTNVQHEEIVN